MNEPKTEQLQKLPWWAQKHIANQEHIIADLNRRLNALEGYQPPTKIYWNELLDPVHYLPDHATVSFAIGHGIVDVMIRNGLLDINARNGSLLIQPRYSNSVYIDIEL